MLLVVTTFAQETASNANKNTVTVGKKFSSKC